MKKQRILTGLLMLSLMVLAAGCQSVHVQDRDGNPIAFAQIKVLVDGEGPTGIAAWTDVMGNAMLPQSVEDGKTEKLEVTKGGYLTRRIERPAGGERVVVPLSKSRLVTPE